MGIRINGESISQIYINGTPLIGIFINGEKIWPDITQSCFGNGYWIDEYPWVDDVAWVD